MPICSRCNNECGGNHYTRVTTQPRTAHTNSNMGRAQEVDLCASCMTDYSTFMCGLLVPAITDSDSF